MSLSYDSDPQACGILVASSGHYLRHKKSLHELIVTVDPVTKEIIRIILLGKEVLLM